MLRCGSFQLITCDDVLPEWFPALGGHTSGSQATGSEKEKPRSGSRWPSVHLSGDNLVVNGPKGALNLVLVPEVKESEDKEVEKGAHCTNKPPLGATCQEVVRLKMKQIYLFGILTSCDSDSWDTMHLVVGFILFESYLLTEC